MAISSAVGVCSWRLRRDAVKYRVQYFVYIMTNKWNTVLYTGVTNDPKRRVGEHKSGLVAGFSSEYKAYKLVYIEAYDTPRLAVTREQQIKEEETGPQQGANPRRRDLASDL